MSEHTAKKRPQPKAAKPTAAKKGPKTQAERKQTAAAQSRKKQPTTRLSQKKADKQPDSLSKSALIKKPSHEAFLDDGVPKMQIVHIASEMAPVSKVGGLADVVFGLTHELAIRGNEVEVILPKYDNMRYEHIHGLCECFSDLWVPWYDGAVRCTVHFGFVYERKCFFIEPHSNDHFFNRGKFYGDDDDVWRFAFFSRAAMEFLYKSGKRPAIIHCHDWHTALVPVLLWEVYQQLGMRNSRVCYTIHNFMHQGLCGTEILAAVGLDNPDYFNRPDRLADPRHPGALNLMKAGIVYSNFVTTVSPKHAFEAKEQGQGFGLEGSLRAHEAKYGGVLNGIDYNAWNPAADPLIPSPFDAEHIDKKGENKRALRHRFQLADTDKPIVAHIGRLDPQKGLDLVRHSIFHCLNGGAQFVLLGSSPEPSINDYFNHLKGELGENPDCHLEIGFHEELAHLIYAGADLILVPSRFEPCGLTQLIAMRYGTIPVVRSVGGLADTVFDKDNSEREPDSRNGFVFQHDDEPSVEYALDRAISCYSETPEAFLRLQQNALRADHSWNVPGQHYLNIYNYIREKS